MWQIISGLLQGNQNIVQGRKDAEAAHQNDVTTHIMNTRAQADQVKNQTQSANFGKFNMDSLVGGVFGSKQQQPAASGMNWNQYA